MFPARFPGSAPARLAIGSYLLRHRRRCPSSQRCVGVRGPYPNAIGSYLYPIWVGSAAAALAVGALSEGETFSSAWTAVGSEPPYYSTAARRAYSVVLETAPLQRFLELRTNALSKLECHCRFVKRSTSRV